MSIDELADFYYSVAGPAPQSQCVELWSLRRLPFDKLSPDLRQMKAELVTRISLLRCTSDQLIHGVYASVVKDACDAENVLFYNVGLASFARSSPLGLRFERIFEGPPAAPPSLSRTPLHYHCYCPTDINAGFQHWRRRRILARWNVQVVSREDLRSVSRVWLLLKSQPEKLHIVSGSSLGWFGLSVELRTSSWTRINAPTLIKPIFDGIISAFHSHNGVSVDTVSDTLSHKLSFPADGIARHLLSTNMAVLGTRQLLWPWRDSVQWNPADERCIAGELFVKESKLPEVAMVGEMFEVEG